MGMYTEFKLDVSLKNETKNGVYLVLNWLTKKIKPQEELESIAKEYWNHPFFSCERKECVLESNSLYYDHIERSWRIESSVEFKNYHQEIQLFLDWIKPYLNSKGQKAFGYMKYEEWEEGQFIQLKNGEITRTYESDYKEIGENKVLYVIREHDTKYQEDNDVYETENLLDLKKKYFDLLNENETILYRKQYEILAFQNYEKIESIKIKDVTEMNHFIQNKIQ